MTCRNVGHGSVRACRYRIASSSCQEQSKSRLSRVVYERVLSKWSACALPRHPAASDAQSLRGTAETQHLLARGKALPPPAFPLPPRMPRARAPALHVAKPTRSSRPAASGRELPLSPQPRASWCSSSSRSTLGRASTSPRRSRGDYPLHADFGARGIHRPASPHSVPR